MSAVARVRESSNVLANGYRLHAEDLKPYRALKRVLDVALGLPMALIALPIIAVAALLTRLTSRGPGLYRQIRLGENGRHFTIYKIRTMTVDSEKNTGACWCVPNDPRVTPLGRILRKTKIDELPQLWNVLRGDMSLVGPRPERPELAERLEQSMPDYSERLQVRPGLSGLAQVQLPADTDLESVRRKLTYDLHYVRNMSLSLDLRILIGTGLYMLGMPFRTIGALLRLQSGSPSAGSAAVAMAR